MTRAPCVPASVRPSAPHNPSNPRSQRWTTLWDSLSLTCAADASHDGHGAGRPFLFKKEGYTPGGVAIGWQGRFFGFFGSWCRRGFWSKVSKLVLGGGGGMYGKQGISSAGRHLLQGVHCFPQPSMELLWNFLMWPVVQGNSWGGGPSSLWGEVQNGGCGHPSFTEKQTGE